MFYDHLEQNFFVKRVHSTLDKVTQKKLRVIILSSDIVKYAPKGVCDLEIYLCALDWVKLNDELFKNENNPERLKKIYN